MGNNNSAHRGVQRHAAQHVAQINEGLDSLEQALGQLITERHSSIGPANIPSAPGILLICTAIKIIRQRFIFGTRRKDINPRFLFVYAMIAVALGCMECGLLMYVVLGDLPWRTFVTCLLMLVVSFAFVASWRIISKGR